LDVVEVTAGTPSESLQNAIARFEDMLKAAPGRWHQWGDIGMYFEPPKSKTER
jgi:hypothetical protein